MPKDYETLESREVLLENSSSINLKRIVGETRPTMTRNLREWLNLMYKNEGFDELPEELIGTYLRICRSGTARSRYTIFDIWEVLGAREKSFVVGSQIAKIKYWEMMILLPTMPRSCHWLATTNMKNYTEEQIENVIDECPSIIQSMNVLINVNIPEHVLRRHWKHVYKCYHHCTFGLGSEEEAIEWVKKFNYFGI